MQSMALQPNKHNGRIGKRTKHQKIKLYMHSFNERHKVPVLERIVKFDRIPNTEYIRILKIHRIPNTEYIRFLKNERVRIPNSAIQT